MISYILGVICIVLAFAVYNLLQKVEKLEDVALDQQKYMQQLSDVINESNTLIETVDERGTFKSDDEVGAFFNYLQLIQETLNSYSLPRIDGKKEE